jgi:tetratricopeptide (TPR) repeat protein
MRFWGVKYRRGLGVVLGALALLAVLECKGVAQVVDADRPLEGESYKAADEAYKAYSRGDYKTASDQAARSAALRPDILRLRLLLIDSLIAAGNVAQADQATTDALNVFSGNQDLKTRQANIRQRLAQLTAGDGYKALERGDAKAAIRAAKSAIEHGPDVISYRLLLLSAQLANNDLADGLVTAIEAAKLDPGSYVPLVWRAYIHQRLGNRAQAIADFDAALAIPTLWDTDRKNIRLIAADAALASGDYANVQKLLGDYPRSDPSIITRLSDAEAAAAHKGTLNGDGKSMPAPAQDCRTESAGTICSLQAPLVRSVLIPIDRAAEANEAADKAYQAARDKDYNRAIDEAHKAIDASPEKLANHLLLINLLMSAGRTAEAEAEATAVINRGDATAGVYAQRGYARNLQHKLPGAMSDWEEALRRGLPPDQSQHVRLALADIALTEKQPQRSLRALQRLPTNYETSIRRAYALQALDRKGDALAQFKIAERLAATDVQRDDALRALISILVQLGRKPEARSAFDQAIRHGQLRTVREADLAYLAASVGNDQLALRLFDSAHAKGQLPPRATLDAGYTAMRQFENSKAIAYLKEGIDARADGRIALDDQKLFETRRTVADLSREWGVNSSILYGKVGSAPNPFLIVGAPSSYTSQLGTEAYYRPEGFGNQNGALFEVFGRLFETLYDQSGGPTGGPTTQGMVGARWKPLAEQNLVFEVDKLVQFGSAARDDTLLRALYSYTVGTDLRAIDTSWPTWMVYAEGDRFLEHTQWVGLFDARFGQSFRLDAINSNLVFFPHVVLAASYDDSFANPQAYSAGLGGSLRYWFGETKYLAPPSYLELTLQYRFRIAGDQRARGIFAQTSLNY